MGADESPAGAPPKETPGGSPGNTRKTEKPCKGDPVPAADECSRSRDAPTGLVVFFSPSPRFPPGVSKRNAPCGGFVMSAGTRGRRAAEVRAREIVRRGIEGRNAFAPKCSETPSPEGATIAQRRVSTLRKRTKKRHARCKCAIAETRAVEKTSRGFHG